MTKNNKKYLLIGIIFIFVFITTSHADVKLPFIFANNMVLQRGIEIPVWGWADKGEEVTVNFAGQTLKTITADENGKWMVKLDPMPVNKNPQSLTISGKNTITISNVLVGDVWICSGQSNMGFGLVDCLDSKKEMTNANYPLIRTIVLNANYTTWPIEHYRKGPGRWYGKWHECNPKTARSFSAAAYFFAREIFNETGIPVGLITTSFGGSKIEAWIPFEGYKKTPELKNIFDKVKEQYPNTPEGKITFQEYIKNMKKWMKAAEVTVNKGNFPKLPPKLPGIPGKGAHQYPTLLYNAMINPIKPYAIKGAIWYQGEANGGENDSYVYKMKALIESWREAWDQGDFPFYYVQLPNFRSCNRKNPAGGFLWTKTREAQLKALSIPNTGMAITIDIGEGKNIHPRNKQDVGKRLAALALAKLYGKDVVASGPLYKEQKIEGNKIRIFFDYAEGGLIAGTKDGLNPVKEVNSDTIEWFAIAGEDKKWYWANAKIEKNTVVVFCDKVQFPVAVRYAYVMNPEGAKLYNKAGIPASPFRTDEW